MMIVYVLPHASLCGGVKVIAEHVTGLCARGHAAEVWGLTGDFGWFPRPVRHRCFGSTDELGEALRVTSAAKVATFWITASWVSTNLLPAERGFYLIQDEDELTYGGSPNGSSYRLGLVPVTEGKWVTETIQHKYGTECVNVGIGIDHSIFRPLPFLRERYRILTPARTYSAGPSGLKGWDIACAAVSKLVETVPQASLVTFGMEDPVNIPVNVPHLHVPHPSDRKLRELYSQSGVFLSCSRHEGFGLPMLEAMACGCPVVCTDAHGNREFCRDGETALIGAGAEELAGALKRVMEEDLLAQRLSIAGLTEASRYRWETVVDRLEALYLDRTAIRLG